MLGSFQYNQFLYFDQKLNVKSFFWGSDKLSIIYTFFIQVLLLKILYHTLKAKSKKEFYNISRLTKKTIFFAIISIPIFSLLYINNA